MIPLSDKVRRRSFPVINILLIIINIAVFVYELSLGERRLQNFVLSFGAIPLEITSGKDIPPSGPPLIWLTLLTSMFIHGGWLHIGGNMLYLWVFGDNIEDAMGHFRYLIFYLLCGVIAAAAQIAVSSSSRLPSIGASGAIAGVLGAYLILFPRARVTTLVFLGYFIQMIPVPAILLIGLWAVMQFFSGVASFGVAAAQTGGVAYWAHIGGFVAGLAMVGLFRRRRRARYAG